MVPDLSESKVQASKTPQKDVVFTHSYVEVRRDHYGFYYVVAEDETWRGFNLGHCQQVEQE